MNAHTNTKEWTITIKEKLDPVATYHFDVSAPNSRVALEVAEMRIWRTQREMHEAEIVLSRITELQDALTDLYEKIRA